MARPHVYFLAPTGPGIGLTSVCLGLVHALDRVGMRVGFMKPIAQPGQQAGPERSTHFIRSTTDLQPPEPLPFPRVEQLLRQGRQGQLLEEVLTRVQQAAEGVEVLVVEGLATELDTLSFEQLNASIAHALDAEVILVGAVGRGTVESFCQRLELSAALYGAGERVLGCIVNRFNAPLQVSGANRSLLQPPDPLLDASDLLNGCALLQRPDFKLIGVIPWERELASLRTSDVAQQLGAQVLHQGEADSRRVVDVSLVARTVANMTGRLRPGALIVTPGDRDDIILAACMAALNGVPLAGLLLTGGIEPDENIMKLCSNAIETGLPVLWTGTDSYMTSAAAAALNQEVPLDDLQRIERVMETIAGHLDVSFLQQRAAAGEDREPRMSPAAFLYSLVNRARQADRRIVLPEGTEPRTVRAAVSCVERGITRCVLLGEPAEVQRVAEAQGLTLPAGLEIIDPEPIRSRYVQPLVELRAHRGMTEPVAREQVKDDVVLGMLMLARGEVDGLVSGAVHTTANILRPALQLIGTREDARLVSSVFFMCLPEQVLVYGDCAVNPDPDAEQLADIAIQSAESAGLFGIAPRVAMISYSTGASGAGVDVEKVREATHIAQERRPDLLIDGPLQYDAASVQSVALSKAPESKVAGRATVIIFPDLNTGNTTYKAVQRSANVVSVGPMLQGLRRPVNDLSRGALVDDIIYTIALTAVQAAA